MSPCWPCSRVGEPYSGGNFGMQRVASVSVPFRGPASGRLFGFTGLGLMATGAGILSLVLSTGTSMATGVVDDRLPLAPLSSVAVPAPSGGTIANQAAAVQLGKALFWDVQVGGDGKQACASCHFYAGEDTRLTNTVNPGPDGIFNSEGITGPGQTILASQADGPPNNPVERSCAHRAFNGANSLGAKMLARQPLQHQQVSSNDGVLGSLANAGGNGLNTSYGDLTRAAFGTADSDSALENSFSSYWGQAVQAYESTLISDQTPMDKYLSGNQSALTQNQANGLNIFQGKGQCAVCHAGAEMTDASVNFYALTGPLNRDGGDQGFHNDGVRPTREDGGRANTGPNGVAWSVSGSSFDRGAFKTPSLRNVGLRRSFFHNGGKATLTDVVNFYNRGGDFANPEKSKDMKQLSLASSDISSLVDFMKSGLTDCRVAKEQAPFDHPALPLNGGADRPATGGNSLCS